MDAPKTPPRKRAAQEPPPMRPKRLWPKRVSPEREESAPIGEAEKPHVLTIKLEKSFDFTYLALNEDKVLTAGPCHCGRRRLFDACCGLPF